MNGIDERRLELLFELMHKPIPWDPLPPWMKFDDKFSQKFAQLEIQFRVKELDLQRQKLEEFGKMVGGKIG
jgi:hypothetical protein